MKNPAKILVTSYLNPDLDGVACAIGYAELLNKLGTEAVAGFFGPPHIEASYVMNRFKFKFPPVVKNPADFDKFIVVDVGNLDDLDKRLAPDKIVEVIDHHKTAEPKSFPNAQLQIEFVGAAATLVAERFHQAGIEPSVMSATLLYAAIISNTMNFKAKVTTDRDHQMAAWLTGQLKLPTGFIKDMFLAKSDLSGKKLRQVMDGDFNVKTISGQAVGIAQIEMVGARNLIESRLSEILEILDEIKASTKADMIFLSVIDLDKGYNMFVAPNAGVRDFIEKLLMLKFKGQVAFRDGITMRKELWPMIKNEVETFK